MFRQAGTAARHPIVKLKRQPAGIVLSVIMAPRISPRRQGSSGARAINPFRLIGGTSKAHFHQICTIPRKSPFAHKRGMSGRDDPRHNLRLTPELKKRLQHAAIDNGRSVNAEILARLEGSFAPDPADLIARALAPLAFLNDDDRRAAADHFARAAALLAKATGDS